MKKMTKQKHHSHLTFEDRVQIQTLLKEGKSLSYISGVLGRSKSTISREIRSHREKQSQNRSDCIHRFDCERNNVCSKPRCSRKCRSCKYCNVTCADYEKEICEQLLRPPYVCNGCPKTYTCSADHYYYKAPKAQRDYRNLLTDRRSGFDLTGEQLEQINTEVSPRILKGQSPYHIKQSLGDCLPVSEATLRRLIEKGELDARNIDLRNKVKRKPRRKSSPMHNEIIHISKIGHMYSDYQAFIKEHDTPTVQMDCVEGTKEDRCVLLTLHFVQFKMQLAFILEDHTSHCVVKALDRLEEALGKDLFRQVVPLLLTDNGHEFTDIQGMERSVYGGKRTTVFFCEPNRSDEKGCCENNHKYIRYIIPKGTSIDHLMQKDISLMMDHINSYKRKSLFGSAPYDVAMNVLPDDFFILLGLEKYPPEEVVLTPALLKHAKYHSM